MEIRYSTLTKTLLITKLKLTSCAQRKGQLKRTVALNKRETSSFKPRGRLSSLGQPIAIPLATFTLHRMSNSVFSVSSFILVLRLFTSPNPNPIYMAILCFLRNVSLQKLWRGKGSWRNILVGRNLVIAACSECNTVAKVISSLDANFAAFVMTIVTNYKFTFAGKLECRSALRNSILRQKSGWEVLGFCIISSLEYGLELRNC